MGVPAWGVKVFEHAVDCDNNLLGDGFKINVVTAYCEVSLNRILQNWASVLLNLYQS